VRRGLALTGNASSAATRAVAVEHGVPKATPTARALATVEEETVALGFGAESDSDLRGWRRHQTVAAARWSASDTAVRRRTVAAARSASDTRCQGGHARR
jgi:hypothetical protein